MLRAVRRERSNRPGDIGDVVALSGHTVFSSGEEIAIYDPTGVVLIDPQVGAFRRPKIEERRGGIRPTHILSRLRERYADVALERKRRRRHMRGIGEHPYRFT